MKEYADLTILTAAGGAANELFDRDLKEVLTNIKDRNTGEGKRSISLVFTFEPTESRNEMEVSVQSKVKLQPAVPARSFAFIGREKDADGNRRLVARTHDIRQEEIFPDEDDDEEEEEEETPVDSSTGEVISMAEKRKPGA